MSKIELPNQQAQELQAIMFQLGALSDSVLRLSIAIEILAEKLELDKDEFKKTVEERYKQLVEELLKQQSIVVPTK